MQFTGRLSSQLFHFYCMKFWLAQLIPRMKFSIGWMFQNDDRTHYGHAKSQGILPTHKSKPLLCIVVLSKMNSSITKLINILLSVQIVRHGILFAIWILQTCYHLPSFWILVIDQVVNRLNLWIQHNCGRSLEVYDIQNDFIKDRTLYF